MQDPVPVLVDKLTTFYVFRDGNIIKPIAEETGGGERGTDIVEIDLARSTNKTEYYFILRKLRCPGTKLDKLRYCAAV